MADIVVNVHEAKTHLSRLLGRVQAGEVVVIARANRPVARLVPVSEAPARRQADRFKGLIEILEGFDAPLPDDILDAFYHGSVEPE